MARWQAPAHMMSTQHKVPKPSAVGIMVNLDRVMLDRRMSLTELSEKTGITMANLSVLKTRKARLVRFSTLDAICTALACQPGDILEHRPAEEPSTAR